MRVFVAGAGGAIGRRLIPTLTAAGHRVVALTSTERGRTLFDSSDVEAAVADALDRDAIVAAIVRAEPEVVVNEATALAGATDIKHFDRTFAATNRLRTEGNDNLIEGARVAGARRFVAQSFGSWNYERTGSAAKSEDDPLDPDPPANQRESLAAIRYLERAVVEAPDLEGVVLRYANLYGPGTAYAPDGEIWTLARKRRFPIVGDGAGLWSFVHVDDAAAATALAVEHGEPGTYNVADDEPVAVRDWLPDYARRVGAKPPRRIPAWLGRIAVGEVGVSLMTRTRGASNAKARRELGWRPLYPTYREGFAETARWNG